jgi:anti-sigma factor RsiW
MKSESAMQQLNALVDAELDLTEQLAMEARIAQDAQLRAQVQALRRLREAIRDGADYHAAPATLRSRIAALGAQAAPRHRGAAGAAAKRWFAWRPASVSLAVCALLAWGIGLSLSQQWRDERLQQEVLAGHVRATLGQRLVDVASSDRHTVKPWLSSKLDFSPPVQPVEVPGAELVGARVDYLQQRAVAALIYRQREHVVTSFVWPTRSGDSRIELASLQGFNLAHWSQAGMTHWVVSDLNRNELEVLAQSLRHADPTH